MNNSIALILSLLVTSTLAGCGSSSDNSAGAAGKTNTDDGSSAGSDSSAGNSSAAGGASNSAAGAPDMSDNGGAVDSGGTTASGGSDTSSGGSGGAAMPSNADCKKLETCCVNLTAGPKDACNHIAGLNSGPSCVSVYGIYNCDSVLAMANNPKSSACTLNNECIQGPYNAYQAAGCKAGGGVASDTCPADGAIACCTYTGGEMCSYTGNESPITQDDCDAMNGKFSATP